MTVGAVAGATIAGLFLVVASCGLAHAADGAATCSPSAVARLLIGGPLALLVPIAMFEVADARTGLIRKHGIVAGVSEVATMTALLLTVVLA